MQELGDFADADSIEYQDRDNHEVYVLKKGDKTLRMTAAGNSVDGGFLSVEVPGMAPKRVT